MISPGGGDIDLLMEVDGIDQAVARKIDFRLALEDRWGETKVESLLHDTRNPEHPIHRIARLEGIRLV